MSGLNTTRHPPEPAPLAARPVDLGRWRGLLIVGAWSAMASVAMIIIQIGIYVTWPPPDSAVGFYSLLLADPVRGVLALDALYVISNLLAYLLYFALGAALWAVSRSAVVVALAFGVLGMAAYVASPRPVEMLALAQAYSVAEPAEQVALQAVGEGMLATWMGTAFDIYYIFNLVTLLIFVALMFRSSVFSRSTAAWGLVAAALMLIPSNLGIVGLVFALASLLPWAVFAVLVGRRLFRLAAPAGETAR